MVRYNVTVQQPLDIITVLKTFSASSKSKEG